MDDGSGEGLRRVHECGEAGMTGPDDEEREREEELERARLADEALRRAGGAGAISGPATAHDPGGVAPSHPGEEPPRT